MRIGLLSTRLAGTDGVSLETEKWARTLQRMGHEVVYCAGELGGYAARGTLIPELHFAHPRILALTERAFGPDADDPEPLLRDVAAVADELYDPLRAFVRDAGLDLLVVENALAIPMNLPLGRALTRLIDEMDLATIAHNHDFFWERERYQGSPIVDFLDTYFPPALPTVQHVTINSIAQRRLAARRGLDAILVPNVHDFATPPPQVDAYSRDVRERFGLTPGDTFVLQPTRVIRRKSIEMALELVHYLGVPGTPLFVTHSSSDEGPAYWQWLTHEAEMMGVDLRLVDEMVDAERGRRNGRKVYSLWDVYPHADLVTYPSTYEGFGNALLEAIYFRSLVVVNRYPVYAADIAPLGFEFVELDGFVGDAAVTDVRDLLRDPQRVHEMTQKNYALAREHFSLEVLEEKLRALLGE